jgi:hypothetical protein
MLEKVLTAWIAFEMAALAVLTILLVVAVVDLIKNWK